MKLSKAGLRACPYPRLTSTLDGNNMSLTRVLPLPVTPHAAWSLAAVTRNTAACNVRVSTGAALDSTLPAPLLFRPPQCRACWKRWR